jgi:putative hydrolase of the HAD superfamily
LLTTDRGTSPSKVIDRDHHEGEESMARITAIASDVGGVLGTNGWDRQARQKAAEEFKIDWLEFEDRHELVVTALELGQLTLDEYLMRTVFYRPRDFTREQFRATMFAQSKPFAEALAVFTRLAGSQKYLLATLNNESLELNLHRIELFGLRKIFDVFFSSCFLGLKKPDSGIYEMVLRLSQRPAEECLFIDDRELNLECASRSGMQTLHCKDPLKLEAALRDRGLEF